MVIVHSLANLPLSNKLLFGVHARFWMQPNILLFVFFGLGIGFLGEYAAKRYFTFLKFGEKSGSILSHAMNGLLSATFVTPVTQTTVVWTKR